LHIVAVFVSINVTLNNSFEFIRHSHTNKINTLIIFFYYSLFLSIITLLKTQFAIWHLKQIIYGSHVLYTLKVDKMIKPVVTVRDVISVFSRRGGQNLTDFLGGDKI